MKSKISCKCVQNNSELSSCKLEHTNASVLFQLAQGSSKLSVEIPHLCGMLSLAIFHRVLEIEDAKTLITLLEKYVGK